MGLISLLLVLGTAAAQAVVPPGTVATGADLKKALADGYLRRSLLVYGGKPLRLTYLHPKRCF